MNKRDIAELTLMATHPNAQYRTQTGARDSFRFSVTNHKASGRFQILIHAAAKSASTKGRLFAHHHTQKQGENLSDSARKTK